MPKTPKGKKPPAAKKPTANPKKPAKKAAVKATKKPAKKTAVKPEKTAKKPSAKQKSIDELQKHEPVIQDRIAGSTVMELAKKHKYSRGQIRNILDAHQERIQTERQALLDDRQEKIHKALEKDVETITALVGESSGMLLEAVKILRKKLKGKDEDALPDYLLMEACNVGIKAFDRVHTIMLNQQKEANKG